MSQWPKSLLMPFGVIFRLREGETWEDVDRRRKAYWEQFDHMYEKHYSELLNGSHTCNCALETL